MYFIKAFSRPLKLHPLYIADSGPEKSPVRSYLSSFAPTWLTAMKTIFCFPIQTL